MRGYKITKDGKKTSYFTTEWDDNTKELYKDLGPKKVESALVVEPTNTGDGSTWNSAGTWSLKFENFDLIPQIRRVSLYHS